MYYQIKIKYDQLRKVIGQPVHVMYKREELLLHFVIKSERRLKGLEALLTWFHVPLTWWLLVCPFQHLKPLPGW